MNSPESSQAQNQSDLALEVASLKKQVFILLVALIVVAGTFSTYLYRQTAQLGKQLNAARPLADSYDAYLPTYTNFLQHLGAFGQAHPEIRPLLTREGVVLQGAPPAH